VARADEVAALVIHTSAKGAEVTLLNRELPSGVPVKLQLSVPGSDPATGQMTIWPQLDDAHCLDAPRTRKQKHTFGLVTSGSGDARVLEGTIPPLQLAANYCIQVEFTRLIPSDILTTISDGVGATPIAWRNVCKQDDREQVVSKAIEETLTKQIGIFEKIAVAPERIVLAATAITTRLDVTKQCDRMSASETTLDLRRKETTVARENVARVKFAEMCVTPPESEKPVPACVTKPRLIAAWPAAVVEKAVGPPDVVPMIHALQRDELGTVAQALVPASPTLGSQLLAFRGLTDDAEKAKALAALQKELTRVPARRELTLYLPNEKKYARLSTLQDRSSATANTSYAALVKGVTEHGATLIRQLETMRVSDEAGAEAWIRGLTSIIDANRALSAAIAAETATDAAADTISKDIQTALKAIATSDSVKELLRTSSTRPVAFSSAGAPSSDEKASWISPTVGILVGAPLIKRAGDRGFDDGWIQPYIGASIYFTRVDRVIDLDDLVGNAFWQRNSLTVGILPNKPDVNGKDVTGPWNAAILPYVGIGHRVTQYIRVDVGIVPFKYASENPTVEDRDWGVAAWVGMSLDADVWGLVAGKVN
jgi:hypothetical protein